MLMVRSFLSETPTARTDVGGRGGPSIKGGANSGHGALAWRSNHQDPCSDRWLRARGGLPPQPRKPRRYLGGSGTPGKCTAPTRLLADKGHDANSLRDRLAATKTEAVISSIRSRKAPIPYYETVYRNRNLIERAFCRLKDWRRIATLYDKLAINFASAIAIAAIIIWWT